LLPALLLSLSFFMGGCHDRFAPIRERGALVVAVEPRMPGLMRVGDELYGYQREILRAYADRIGVELEFVACEPDELARLMRHRAADMAIYTIPVGGERRDSALLLCSSSYVVLARQPMVDYIAARNIPLSEALRGSNILVSADFRSTAAYRELLDSLGGANIFISDEEGFHLIEQLSCRRCDFLICEKSEALLGCALAGDIGQVHDFEEQIPVYIKVNSAFPRVGEDFALWLYKYRNSAEYARLNDTFFDEGIVGQYIGNGDYGQDSVISGYDYILRRVAAQQGHDWRLLAAMAFSESRFHPLAVSPRGARGLMQVLPRVAQHYNVNEEELMEPETNVRVADSLLCDIRRSLRFAAGTPEEDRLSIILACYNAGLGRVGAVRSMIADNGDDPDSWDDVERYLRSKGDMAPDSVYGDIPGNETANYVDEVMYKYGVYRRKTGI